MSKFNNNFSKPYVRILQLVRLNDEFAFVYYFKAFDESFSFLLKEKDIQKLEVALVVALNLEKNIVASKKVRPSPSRLFDLQGKASQEVKKERVDENNEIPARFVDLLQHYQVREESAESTCCPK